MSINVSKVRAAVRKRVVSATGITPTTQLQLENREFDPRGKNLWMVEHCIGGVERTITPRRSRITAFLVQYDVMTPIGSGSSAADTACQAIFDEFDMANAAKSTVAVDNCTVLVTQMKREVSAGKEWQRNTVLLTLDICSN